VKPSSRGAVPLKFLYQNLHWTYTLQYEEQIVRSQGHVYFKRKLLVWYTTKRCHGRSALHTRSEAEPSDIITTPIPMMMIQSRGEQGQLFECMIAVSIVVRIQPMYSHLIQLAKIPAHFSDSVTFVKSLPRYSRVRSTRFPERRKRRMRCCGRTLYKRRKSD